MSARSVGDQVACRFPEVSVANHKTIRIAELQQPGSLLIAGTITIASMYAMEAPSMSSNMPIEVTSHKEKIPVEEKKEGRKEEKKKDEKETKRVKYKLKDKKKSKRQDFHIGFSAGAVQPSGNICEKPVFGVPLTLAVERSKCHDGIELPAIFRECIDYIEEHGLLCEGIYRISGVKSKVQMLKEAYNNGVPAYLYEHEPNVVASLLKQFLRELPEPVLTTALMPKFEDASTIKNHSKCIEQFRTLIDLIPNCNRLLLSWMIVHMTHIIKRQKENKMSLQNVSIVLSPTMQISHRVLNVFFSNVKELFSDTCIKKYIPPLKPATSRWSLELPDNLSALEEELAKQESLLDQLHEELNAGVEDTSKNEQLWEVQRVVTQLKRKIKFARKTMEAAEKRKKDIEQQKRVASVHEEDELKLELQEIPLANESEIQENATDEQLVKNKQKTGEVTVSFAEPVVVDSDDKQLTENQETVDEAVINHVELTTDTDEKQPLHSQEKQTITTADENVVNHIAVDSTTVTTQVIVENQNSIDNSTKAEVACVGISQQNTIDATTTVQQNEITGENFDSFKEETEKGDVVDTSETLPISQHCLQNTTVEDMLSQAIEKSRADFQGDVEVHVPAEIQAIQPVVFNDCKYIEDEELLRLLEEEEALKLEEEELIAIGDELHQKIETEQSEIERLHQEIVELNYLRQDSDLDEISCSSESSSESEDEEELQEHLNQLIRDNELLEKKNTELCQKIHEERMICLDVKVQIRLLQQKQQEPSNSVSLGVGNSGLTGSVGANTENSGSLGLGRSFDKEATSL
ncbi:ralA-binding protein 1-like [Octopus vulgaris]|uniref:RalA-binding protein 1-like n=2 Tax=Octopus vulgaris TaxID=6645 RepID=A0AA36MIS7_OCTVU|nr:ralA-binding protein 1-like [Octopus vulgaris]